MNERPFSLAVSSAGSSSDSSRRATTSGCRKSALASKDIFPSSAITLPSVVTTSGLISTRSVSRATAASANASRKATAFENASPSSPRPYAMERAWKPRRPNAGSISSIRILSGVVSATTSISVPPSVDAITMLRLVERSRTIETYSSVAMSMPCSMYRRLTALPSSPVCTVTRVDPSLLRPSSRTAASAASIPPVRPSRTTVTPPRSGYSLKRPLPRPPAWICDFTTTTAFPVDSMSGRTPATASSTVVATKPAGTTMPRSSIRAFAWCSWIFTRPPLPIPRCRTGRSPIHGSLRATFPARRRARRRRLRGPGCPNRG